MQPDNPVKHLLSLSVLGIERGNPLMADKKAQAGELLQGTLDLLILKALATGPMHGYGVAEWIHASSQDVLRVEEGALYPALHRLELRGLLSAEWGMSDNNRRAKYYALTAAGRKQLAQEAEYWRREMSGRLRGYCKPPRNGSTVREVLNQIWRRLKAAPRRTQLHRDLEDEVAFHLNMRAEKLRTAGMNSTEARYASRRQSSGILPP